MVNYRDHKRFENEKCRADISKFEFSSSDLEVFKSIITYNFNKRLICQLCLDVVHANCVNLKHRVWNRRDAESWTCNDCSFHVLPFKNYDYTIDKTLAVHVSPKNINTHHIESLKHHRRRISIAHLNTQYLALTFDAFHLMLENHKLVIVALSETWLKDNKHQNEYVQIPGYNTVFRNRENKKGGESVSVQKTTWETIWIEVRGKNKNSAFLIGAFYQPSSDEKEKQYWPEKFWSFNCISLCKVERHDNYSWGF